MSAHSVGLGSTVGRFVCRHIQLWFHGTDPATAGPTISTVASNGAVGAYPSITIGTNGNPVISYYSANGVDLSFAACGNPTCANYPARNR